MNRAIDLMADLLTLAANAENFADDSAIRRRFVRDRLDWVRAELARGRSLDEVARILGVPPELVHEELLLRALQNLLDGVTGPG